MTNQQTLYLPPDDRRESAIKLLELLLSKAKNPDDDTFKHLRLGQYLCNLSYEKTPIQSGVDIFYIENDALVDRINIEQGFVSSSP